MKSFTGWSIRTHLFLLVLLSVAPALLIIIYSGFEQKKKAIADVNSSCYSIINAITNDMENTVAGTRQMLATLAALPVVRNHSVSDCNTLFADILKKNPHYVRLQAYRPNGALFASAAPLREPVNAGNRKFFRDAVRTRDFSAGEYSNDRSAHQSIIDFGYPILDDNGGIIAVIQVGINLAHFDSVFDTSRLPEGSVLIMDDHRGTILYHSTHPEKFIGASDNHQVFNEMDAKTVDEAVVSRYIDQKKYLIAYNKLRLPKSDESYIYIRLQVPEEAALAGIRKVLTRNIFFLIIAAMLTALAVMLFANYSIINRAERLVRASEQLADGNWDVKVGISHSDGEFGLIAGAFEKMAGSLAQRDEERIRYFDELENVVNWALDERSKNEAIIASIGDGISIVSKDYRILYQNGMHQELSGGDHTGTCCHEVYFGRADVCPDCHIRMAFEDGRTHTVEKEFSFGGKQSYVLITASPILDSSGEIVSGIELVKDITDRKMIEIELERMNNKLAESNRELQHFAYIASHDLQEPLRTITSFIQLLAKRYKGKLDQDADEFIGFITDGAGRMQRLINDLLAYSRVESKGKPFTEFDGERALEHTLANLLQSIKGNSAEITHAPLPLLYGDEVQVVQLLQNLIGNALKFHGSEPPRVHVGCADRTTEWEISVHDNGIGIDPRFFERIFEIFQRLHSREQYAGTGIGLAICKKIVERHGGRIWLESEPGKGTTFLFTIRKAPGEAV